VEPSRSSVPSRAAKRPLLLAGAAAVAGLAGVGAWLLWRSLDSDIAATAETTAFAPGAASPASTGQAEPAEPAEELQAAVDRLAGDITATRDGSVAVLEGYVANDGEAFEAEQVAAAVDGVESVDNRLAQLQPLVVMALAEAGVIDPTANGVGTEMLIGGTINGEADREGAVAAAAEVEGVSNVVDELALSLSDELNKLPAIQFETASATILPVSYPELDAAVGILSTAGSRAQFEIRGFADGRGTNEANLQLSQERADAVLAYLIAAGANPGQLSALGYGETELFAGGGGDEALAANRVVVFVQVG
jgi:outer membrane protein OmpA-like peptidoglycan-associated protein